MRRLAEPSNIISILALVIAAFSLWLNSRSYYGANSPPQLFVKTNETRFFRDENNSTSVSGDFDVAVTNTSGGISSIVSCVVGVANFDLWEGGRVAELLLPCGVLDDKESLKIPSGQTEFFSGKFKVNNINAPETLLPLMGFSPEEALEFVKKNSCVSQFNYNPRSGYSMNTCFKTPDRVLFTIYLQTGKAENIAMAVPSSGTNNWPWLNLPVWARN